MDVNGNLQIRAHAGWGMLLPARHYRLAVFDVRAVGFGCTFLPKCAKRSGKHGPLSVSDT